MISKLHFDTCIYVKIHREVFLSRGVILSAQSDTPAQARMLRIRNNGVDDDDDVGEKRVLQFLCVRTCVQVIWVRVVEVEGGAKE